MTSSTTTRRATIGATFLTTAAVLSSCLPAPAPWSGSPAPFGSFDTASVTADGEVTVSGWADESDNDSPVTVVFFANGARIGTATANQARADVTARYPKSIDVGFSASISASAITPGTTVCASAVNRGAGDHSVLGCRPVVAAAMSTAAPTTAPTPTSPPTTAPATPQAVATGSIAAGNHFSVALADDGALYAWGSNGDGQLGDNSINDHSAPTAVSLPAGAKVVAVETGAYHAIALRSDGTVLTWGYNGAGQIGDDSLDNRLTPGTVTFPAGTTITAVAAGNNHSYALSSTGTVYAWGANSVGQLGDGSADTHLTPVAVDLPDGPKAIAISSGNHHGLALREDGSVVAWGYNNRGQIGDNTTTFRSTPVVVDVPAGPKVNAISAGAFHSLALREDGSVLAWGDNSNGQLGDGSSTGRWTATLISTPAGAKITALVGGGYHTIALRADGTLLAWGMNAEGQLGDGTGTNRNTPVSLTVPGGAVTSIAAGEKHTLARRADGRLFAWGINTFGQLGNGDVSELTAPALIAGIDLDGA